MSGARAKQESRQVMATLPNGERREVAMTLGDFNTLKRIADADGKMEIQHAKKEFRLLHDKRLVAPHFVPRGDWTVAVMKLTDLGRAVLAAEFQR